MFAVLLAVGLILVYVAALLIIGLDLEARDACRGSDRQRSRWDKWE